MGANRVGTVTFASKQDCERALKAVDRYVAGKKRVVVKKLDEGNVVKEWMEKYAECRPDRARLSAQADGVAVKRLREEEERLGEGMLGGRVDEDGFTMVVPKKKRSAAAVEVQKRKDEEMAERKAKRAKKDAELGGTFYRFEKKKLEREKMDKLKLDFKNSKIRAEKLKAEVAAALL